MAKESGGESTSPDERPGLLRAAASGDRPARNRLLEELNYLVADAARQREGRSLEGGDLFQEGTIGLLSAIDSFHDSGQKEFESYAREQIALRMDAALQEEDAAVERAASLVRAAEEYERGEQQTRRELGRPGTDEEVAGKLKWSLEHTRKIKEMVQEARRRHDEDILSFLDPQGDGDDSSS
jgi:RNA polymerase sigma factor (sigma-70 family)